MKNTQAAIEEAMSKSPYLADQCLQCVTKTGTWLSDMLYTVNGAEMGDQEYRYALLLCYGIESSDLPPNCDG